MNIAREDRLVTLLYADANLTIENPLAGYEAEAKERKESAPAPELNRAAQLDDVPDSTIEKLRRLKDPYHQRLFAKILAGESFAPAGKRDESLQRAASSIAFADEGKSKPEALAEILRPSLSVWASEPGAEKSLEEELEKAVEKLTRAQDDWQKRHGKRLAELEGLRRALSPGSSPEQKFLALQNDTVAFVWDFEKKAYRPPHPMREIALVMRDAWPEGSPVELNYLTTKGEARKKTTAQLMEEYGTALESVVYSFEHDRTIYDPATGVLRVPAAKRRPLEARYWPEVEKWLSYMPARPHHLDMLLDWLSTVTCLHKMSAALYLSGPKSTGKSLLVTGISRLWNQGPTKLEHVFRRFNGSLLKCPLINADEAWRDQNVNLAAELRELVGNMSHQIEQKGRPIVTLEGAVRLVITANNETLLQTRGNGDQNQMERDATIERILHVPTSGQSAEYLQSVKDRHLWREENRIAEHLLWLKEERAQGVMDRAIEEGHRFLIQGDATDTDFYEGIGSKPKDFDAAVLWLSYVLTRPQPPPSVRKGVSVAPGRFAVVPRAVVDSWKTFGLDELFDRPTGSRQATTILRPFTGARTKVNGDNAYMIDIERFARAARMEGTVSAEVLKEKLGIDV